MFDGLYKPFMVIRGMVYYCYTNITGNLDQFKIHWRSWLSWQHCEGVPWLSEWVDAAQSSRRNRAELRIRRSSSKFIQNQCLHKITCCIDIDINIDMISKYIDIVDIVDIDIVDSVDYSLYII